MVREARYVPLLSLKLLFIILILFTSGHKLMTPFNLARMGLVNPIQRSMYKSPKYPSAWTLKPLNEVLDLANRFFRHLNDGPHGPYHATSLIFGRPMADRLSSVSQDSPVLQCIPPPLFDQYNPKPVASSSKRSQDLLSDASEDPMEPPRPSSKRRRI